VANNLLNRLHPLTIIFLAYALLFALIGYLSGFEHKIINMIIVIGSAVNALLIQLWYKI